LTTHLGWVERLVASPVNQQAADANAGFVTEDAITYDRLLRG
jgi:hypothetical protein